MELIASSQMYFEKDLCYEVFMHILCLVLFVLTFTCPPTAEYRQLKSFRPFQDHDQTSILVPNQVECSDIAQVMANLSDFHFLLLICWQNPITLMLMVCKTYLVEHKYSILSGLQARNSNYETIQY